MKRLCLIILSVFSLLLSACGGQADLEKYNEFKSQLAGRDSLSFTSDIRCEYPEKTVEFSLYFEGNNEGCFVKVLKPKIISGISARFDSEGTRLSYKEVELDTGKLDRFGLSPMSALPSLAATLKDGYAESCWEDGDYIVYELILNENLKANIWFNSLGTVPVKAEIISGDSVKVFCTIDNWLKIME